MHSSEYSNRRGVDGTLDLSALRFEGTALCVVMPLEISVVECRHRPNPVKRIVRVHQSQGHVPFQLSDIWQIRSQIFPYCFSLIGRIMAKYQRFFEVYEQVANSIEKCVENRLLHYVSGKEGEIEWAAHKIVDVRCLQEAYNDGRLRFQKLAET